MGQCRPAWRDRPAPHRPAPDRRTGRRPRSRIRLGRTGRAL